MKALTIVSLLALALVCAVVGASYSRDCAIGTPHETAQTLLVTVVGLAVAAAAAVGIALRRRALRVLLAVALGVVGAGGAVILDGFAWVGKCAG